MVTYWPKGADLILTALEFEISDLVGAVIEI